MSNELISIIVSVIVSALTTIAGYLIFFGRKLEQLDRLCKDHDSLSTETKELLKEIAALKEFKANTQKFIDSSIYKSKSPLSLTEFGEKLIKESGFKEIFEKEKGNLAGKLFGKQPKTKYDVQEKARELMNELTEYLPFQPLKEYAFKTGNDYAQILRAGAIPLRDYYLSKHPEITLP
jgi:hypothetical protein